MKKGVVFLSGLVFLLFCSSAAFTDEVRLQDGRVLVGIVQDRPLDARCIRLEIGGRVLSLLRTEVLSIKRGRTPLHDYYQLEESLKGSQNPADYLTLFDFAQQHRFFRFEKPLMQKVLSLDSENTRARRYLGYRTFQGKWMSRSQVQQAVGMVEVNGVWMTTAERALLKSKKLASQLKKAERDLKTEKRRVLRSVVREYSDAPGVIKVSDGIYHRPSWFWPYYFRPDRVLPGRGRFPVGFYDASPTLDILDFPGVVIPGRTP